MSYLSILADKKALGLVDLSCNPSFVSYLKSLCSVELSSESVSTGVIGTEIEITSKALGEIDVSYLSFLDEYYQPLGQVDLSYLSILADKKALGLVDLSCNLNAYGEVTEQTTIYEELGSVDLSYESLLVNLTEPLTYTHSDLGYIDVSYAV